MPFYASETGDQGWQVSRLKLQVVDDKLFHILTPFYFDTANRGTPVRTALGQQNDPPGNFLVPGFAVPDHHDPSACEACTDFASVPRPIRGILGTYGRQLAAALVHDQLCRRAAEGATWKDRGKARDLADRTFFAAMRDSSAGPRVTRFQAHLFWGGVSIVRFVKYRPHKLAVLLIGMIAGWLSALAVFQAALQSGSHHSLRIRWGHHFYVEAYWWILALAGLLLASAVLRSKSQRHPKEGATSLPERPRRRVIRLLGRVLFVLGVAAGVLALALALPLPVAGHLDLWVVVVDLDRPLPCLALAAALLLICTLGSLLLGEDRALVPVGVLSIPWTLPVFVITFVAQQALQVQVQVADPASEAAATAALPASGQIAAFPTATLPEQRSDTAEPPGASHEGRPPLRSDQPSPRAPSGSNSGSA